MLAYIIQVILFQILFLMIYDFFLSKETFFIKNRFYLLFTAVASFALPLIKIPRIKSSIPEEYTILLPEVVLSPQTIIEKQSWYQSIAYFDILFWLGFAVFLSVFIYKIYSILKLLYENNIQKYDGYHLVILPNTSKAFSFFNYIFLGENISESSKEKVIKHELVHSKQKHSIDLLLFEMLKIVMWFNPMIWVFQKRIASIHEFLSDEVASKLSKKETYINNLLEEVFQVQNISFVNQFYKQSLIKKRIVMMTKSRSKQSKQLRYLMLIPVLTSMLFYTACSGNETLNKPQELDKQKLYLKTLDNELKTSDNDSYMDALFSGEAPNSKEYSIEDLTMEEREEYEKTISKEELKNSTLSIKPRIFEGKNNRKVLFYDFKEMHKEYKERHSLSKGNKIGNNVSFANLDVAPAFIGKGEGKEAFNRNMRRFIQENFDAKMAEDLGLKPGKKRIYVQFKINEEGEVINIKSRAPHPRLQEHAEEIVRKLPKLKPGEHEGKVVKVGYTLPIIFKIE